MLKVWVKICLALMSKDDRADMAVYVRRLVKLDEDDADSVWSVVQISEDEKSPTTSSSVKKRFPSEGRCNHERTTRLGTNQYQCRLSCKDCGAVLEHSKKRVCRPSKSSTF